MYSKIAIRKGTYKKLKVLSAITGNTLSSCIDCLIDIALDEDTSGRIDFLRSFPDGQTSRVAESKRKYTIPVENKGKPTN